MEKKTINSKNPRGIRTKKELAEFLEKIAENVIDQDKSYIHSMLALDRVFRQPNAEKLLDENLKEQARDLWLQIKSTGIQITDPPILFGIPDREINGEESTTTKKSKGNKANARRDERLN